MQDKQDTVLNGQPSEFNAHEWLRYTRHLQLPQFGVEGQTRLKHSHVLIVGAGGLGSPVSLYLSAAGVGNITIFDHDEIELSNLQRQVLFRENDISHNKANAAAQHLQKLNSEINIRAVGEAFTEEHASSYMHQADIVVDCTDNFTTRYLINDLCCKFSKPWVFASIHQFSGQCSLFSPKTACFRCLFPEAPQNIADCNSAGVIGVLPGLLGTIQASETVKYLAGLETPLQGKLLLFDALRVETQKIRLAKDPECKSCCNANAVAEDALEKGAEKTPASHEYNPISRVNESEGLEISVQHYLERYLQISDHPIAAGKSRQSALVTMPKQHSVLDVRSEEERAAFHLGGKHIPLDELDERKGELKKNISIACYCQSGTRSLKAAEQLSRLGFSAFSIHGGIEELLKKDITAL